MQYVALVAFAVMLAAGQVLFKQTALAGADQPLPWGLLNGWLLAALVLYGAATVLWVIILRTVPLSLAYPFAALGFVIVPVAGAVFFGEPITWQTVLGAGLIVAGILVTVG